MTPIRLQLHQMIDAFPEDVLVNVFWALVKIRKHQDLISHINNLPIYDMSNANGIKKLKQKKGENSYVQKTAK